MVEFLVVLLLALPSLAVERSDIPDKYKWDTTQLYATDAAWAKNRDEIAGRIPKLGAYQGHLGESATKFYEALSSLLQVDQELSQLSTYANMRSDEDTRAGAAREMKQSAEDLTAKFATATSFYRPEIIAVGAEKVKAFVAAEPKLKPYQPWLDDILRYAPESGPALHARRSPRHRAQGGGAARARLPEGYEARLRRALDGHHAHHGQALRRVLHGCLWRAPVPARELQWPLRERVHDGPRARPLDAYAALVPASALRDLQLQDLRGRGGLYPQRESTAALHALADQGQRHAAVPIGHLRGQPAHHAVPPDVVRGIRVARARDVGEGRATDWGETYRALPQAPEGVLRR